MKDIVLTLYSLPGCMACERLYMRLLSRLTDARDGIRVASVVFDPERMEEDTPVNRLQAFPTLIASCDGVNCFGWQGFDWRSSEAEQAQIIEDIISRTIKFAHKPDQPMLEPSHLVNEPGP